MSLDEKSIYAINEYFAELAQSAVDIAYGESDEDTSFAEFMENVTHYLHLLSAEHVATEVLELSSSTIEKYNDGNGITVDDVQALIEEKEDEDGDGEDDDEEIY
jgi:hypothetical protein